MDLMPVRVYCSHSMGDGRAHHSWELPDASLDTILHRLRLWLDDNALLADLSIEVYP